jgi:AraC family transcriptional regulator
MSIEIVERPAVIVVGMHIKTRPMSAEIPALWPKFVPRIDEVENPVEPAVSYGVMWHGATIEELHYMAAVSAASAGRVPAGMQALTLPAGIHASFKYPLSGLGQGFREIFQRLLPASKYAQAPGPYFERYDETFDPRNPGSLVEICLPVRERRE